MVNNGFSFEQLVNEIEIYFSRSKSDKLYRFILQAVEKPLIENVLDRAKGNQSEAAKALGINRNTLHSKIKKLGIEVTRRKKY